MNPDPHPGIHWPPGWGPDRCDSFVNHRRRTSASADAVFAQLAAVDEWPKWQRAVDRTEVIEDLAVGSRFVVVSPPHTFDGIVGEFVPPTRFGWAAVGDQLSFYQSWLLLDEPGGGALVIFEEASRGLAALLHATGRAELTRGWLDTLPPPPEP